MSYLACDLGAESGRLMLGRIDGQRINLEELHRFANVPVKHDASLRWDIDALWRELQTGLRKAGALGIPITSISTDSWGLDYALFDERLKIIQPTFHYRDARTARGVQAVKSLIDWPTLFEETGIQFMPFNTVYQLAAETPDRLKRARLLLMIGDAFNCLLSGIATSEESLASTSAIYNPRTRNWSAKVMDALAIPPGIFTPISLSGTKLGPLRDMPELKNVEVIASCSHDTGAAVAAVPARGSDWAYISSGTWSLMGIETDKPVLTDLCRELNFTNEIGFGRTVRLLKNIVGLWIVQECRREWAAAGGDYDYGALARLAGEAADGALINPGDPRFLTPGNMAEKIATYCRETGQKAPESPGAVVRCGLRSLALQYRKVLGELERLIRTSIRVIHIVGGGSKNRLLNQFTANATGLPVVAGPVEATALGNVLVQAIAAGELGSLAEARQTVGTSFELETFEPAEQDLWDAAAEIFARLPES